MLELDTKMERKYKSKRLDGIQGDWSDSSLLLYIKDRVDFRTSHPDLKEALDKRISSIIEKLVMMDFKKFKESDEKDALRICDLKFQRDEKGNIINAVTTSTPKEN